MRIITRLTVSGPSTHVLLANQGLAQLGWETLLVHGLPEPDEQAYDLADVDLPMIQIASLRRPIAPRDAAALLTLVRLIRRYRPTVVHTHHSKGGLLGRLAATVAGVPIRVHTFHGTVFEGYFSPRVAGAFVVAERAMARLTTRLVVLTEAQRRDLIDRSIGTPDQIEVVPLGLELGRFAHADRAASRRRLGLEDGQFILVAAGRFAPIKRIDRLLRVFARVRAEVPAARLHLLGDGPLRAELEQLAATLGVRNAINFAGWRDDVDDWYAASDVVVNTSDNEGSPLALIEAGATGRSVVATRVGGVVDVVDDGKTGLLFERDDIDAMVAGLVRLARDAPSDRDRMGEAAKRRSIQYGGDRLVADLDRLYRTLMHDHRR
jgi:glycosyltransferase involved in cell wall biosynthesis